MGDCISWCNPVFKAVDKLPSLEYATRNHAYILNGVPYVLNEEGNGFIELKGSSGSSVAYDDTPLKERIKALENKEDKDTIYNDKAITDRITALEGRADKDEQTLSLEGNTLSISNGNSVVLPEVISYNDSELRTLINTLEAKVKGTKPAKITYKFNKLNQGKAPSGLDFPQLIKWVRDNYYYLWGQNFGNFSDINTQNVVPTQLELISKGTEEAPEYEIRQNVQTNTYGGLRYLGSYNPQGDVLVSTLVNGSPSSICGQSLIVEVQKTLNASGSYFFGVSLRPNEVNYMFKGNDFAKRDLPESNTYVDIEGLEGNARIIGNYVRGNYAVIALQLEAGKTYTLKTKCMSTDV